MAEILSLLGHMSYLDKQRIKMKHYLLYLLMEIIRKCSFPRKQIKVNNTSYMYFKNKSAWFKKQFRSWKLQLKQNLQVPQEYHERISNKHKGQIVANEAKTKYKSESHNLEAPRSVIFCRNLILTHSKYMEKTLKNSTRM